MNVCWFQRHDRLTETMAQTHVPLNKAFLSELPFRLVENIFRKHSGRKARSNLTTLSTGDFSSFWDNGDWLS